MGYHFLPVMRYYLIVKDKTADDIECVFRSNSVSSCTLALPQIIGILFIMRDNHVTFWSLASWERLSVFTWINILSQVVNRSITLAYLLTPVSMKMVVLLKAEALVYNSQKR